MDRQEVAASYDRITVEREKVGAEKGTTAGRGKVEEDSLPYRHFNNFIKRGLINGSTELFSKSGLRMRPAPAVKVDAAAKMAVLDLASGRGGDLQKWLFSNRAGSKAGLLPVVDPLWGFDISPQCVAAAVVRAADIRASARSAPQNTELGEVFFEVADCFSPDFWQLVAARQMHREGLGASPLPERFDIVACFYALHYGCRSQQTLNDVVRGVAACLAPGGLFVGTIVDGEELSARLRKSSVAIPSGDVEVPPSLRNGLFHVRIVEAESRKWVQDVIAGNAPAVAPVGFHYHFHLNGHVDSDEFAVPYGSLEEACAACGLTPVPKLSHTVTRSQIMAWHGDKTKLRALGDQADMSDDERHLVSLYRTFCFQKQ
jgi:hypothetical protein